jgi:hypothetical protein
MLRVPEELRGLEVAQEESELIQFHFKFPLYVAILRLDCFIDVNWDYLIFKKNNVIIVNSIAFQISFARRNLQD